MIQCSIAKIGLHTVYATTIPLLASMFSMKQHIRQQVCHFLSKVRIRRSFRKIEFINTRILVPFISSIRQQYQLQESEEHLITVFFKVGQNLLFLNSNVCKHMNVSYTIFFVSRYLQIRVAVKIQFASSKLVRST